MADNLIFPIGFDLQKAVEEASQNWDKKYAKRLEQAIAKRPVRIKLEFDKLEDVKKRLAELKIQPITKETRSAIRELAKELQVLAKALEQVQKFSKTTQLGQRNFTNDVQMEKLRQANERLEIQKRRVALAEQKHAEAMQRSATASRQLSSEYQNQDGYISRLLKRMAVYAGYSMVTNFLTSVRNVTAEFELQRISLGAIIQDQQKANQIFAEIKSFALTSPLKILDLTKYAKQVAAYGFEADRIFDVTKRLADISVGLGVDMGRLTLAVSQIRAATVLKSSELRQLTETGLPMLDLLSKKLTETQGKLVSAADVMDLISKRAISYEMVEEILYDLTDAGGMFYNMQVKQSQTLYGMWSKLGDAAAIMYDQIGNTSTVNAGMKTTMGLLESMMRNWKTTARVLDTVSVALAVYVIGLKNATIASNAVTTAEAARLAITNRQIIATPKLIAAIIGQNTATKLSTTLTKAHTVAMLNQSTATNVLSRGFWKLTAAMLANPWVAAAAGIALVVTALIHFIGNTETAAERAEKLNNSVASLKSLTTEVEPLIDTYKELADKTERTANEQKKLNEVATELAQKFPAAITVIKEYGQEMGLAADEVARLYENMKRMKTEDVRQKLAENESAVNKLIQRRQQLQKYFDEGKMWVGGGGTGGGGGAMVAMSDEEKRRVTTLITDIDKQILELNESIINAKRELGELPSEATQSIEGFGAWKKKLTEFNKDVGGMKIRLFDDSTINQFGTLEEALDAIAKKYNDATASVEKNNNVLKSLVLKPEERDKISAERDAAQATKELSENALKYYNAMALVLKSIGGSNDPRLSILQKMVSTLKQVNKEYDSLAKKEGATKALADTQNKYANTFKYLQSLATKYKFELPDFGVPTDAASLTKYLNAIKTAMAKLPKSEKAVLSLETDIADINMDDAQKKIEAELKRLADRISRTKTAKEFYEKILSQTGDVNMAINLTTSIFGENGQDLNKQIALQINELMQSGEGGIEIGLDVIGYNINYKNLRKFTEEAYKAKKISDQAYKDLIAIAANGEKDVSKMVDGWLKATEKAKSYSDKLLDLARTTNVEIAKIEAQRTAGNITDEYAEAQIQGYKDKQAQEIAKLQYEAFKDSPMYVQMFDDLDNASTTMLRNMKQRIEELKTSWKDLTPTQLKEMQSRLNEIDAQLAKRNPFKGLIDGIKQYRNLRKNGDALGNKSEGAAEKALDAASKARLEAEKEYLELLQKEGATQKEISDAKKRFDDAAADEAAAAKAVENWKKVKDAIGLSSNELFQMLNWAGDIARGIADISEAMGADEEDVQYWNDVADALGQISGGIQDIVSAAMSGNVVGVISSVITAIPKMFVGFSNLFSAGKIKRANKEIKRQQELLDQLEYTYGRLEKAADKAFGADYVASITRQVNLLKAEAEAKLKQAEAERSKGKKEDEEKTKQYIEEHRDILDQIADMEGKVSERMFGMDLTSAARDFATAWLDAYKEFGNTADAMSEKFHEMIENMIAESLLAKVMEQALKPAFEMIENMKTADFYNESFWRQLMITAEQGANNANHGAEVVMSWLEKMGMNIRGMGGEFSGIAKNIAGATSEEINNVAGIGNTLMYYVSPIPTISENVALIRQLMERGTTSTLPDTTAAGWTDWERQAMDNYIAIQRNTADTVVECRRAANACEAATEKLNRIIVAKGGKFAVNTTYV